MTTLMPNNFILNGFDRSGTSAVSRVLATHPEMELIMQPFNSGSIRKKLYEIIDDSNATREDYEFFSGLEKGVLIDSYIRSHWHHEYSTTKAFSPGKVHVIKTTQNHFAVKWAHKHFPQLPHWGVWREPMDILASLVRNSFHLKWYRDAFPALVNTVLNDSVLRDNFYGLIGKIDNPVREMAFIISVKTWFYFKHISPRNIIYYESFVENANKELGKILESFSLSKYDFSLEANRDLNIIGKSYARGESHKDVISEQDQLVCRQIFSPLEDLMRQ